jgi:predicted lipid-binding transport protein (Tim44 family)
VVNLQVGEPHTFLAEGTLVHNKGGGCFPAGTPIQTPAGQVPIETLVPGDVVLAVDPQGNVVTTQVERIHRTKSLPFVIQTGRGALTTTADHPLALPDGRFVRAAELQSGHKALSREQGDLQATTILSSTPEEWPRVVYNLSVSWPHTFLASGFAVHNKGGSSSSYRSSSSSSSSSEEAPWWLILIFIFFFVLFPLFVFVAIWRSRAARVGSAKAENLDFVYSRRQIDRKAKKTEKLLQFVAAQDATMDPAELKKMVEATFRKLQECWQARQYVPMQPLMMPALYTQHNLQIQGMIRDHEIDHIEDLKVERIDLVNVRYTEKVDQREFTALISASAKDYYTDDRTGKFIRGDRSPARFQEFWTFQRFQDRWVVRDIEQSGESDTLKEENFVEMLTDENIQNLYAETAKEGTDAAWLSKEEAKKATRIERLLNFLAQTDKLWNRRLMLERARQIFMSVYLAREAGDPQQIPAGDIFPDVAQSLKEQMQQWETEGLRIEYRNLCVRKAELIHVRNYDDRSRDEYTVRIDAHAQQVVRKGDHTEREQPYVTPFEEFWTFGRLDDQWKLKEVVSASQAKQMISTENIDEDSSAGQLDWYYRQTRAN